MRFAGKDVTQEQVKGTLAMLRHYRAFLASDPTRYAKCRDLQSGWIGGELNRQQVRERLGWLVNVAINRKAGLPEGRMPYDFWKECQIAQYVMHRTGFGLQFWYSNMRRFDSRILQRRFGDTLATFTADRNEDRNY